MTHPDAEQSGVETQACRTPDDVATYFGVSRKYVYQQVSEGRWPHHRMGQRIIFTPADLGEIDELARRPTRPRTTRRGRAA